jgi:hypothetical protein
MKPKPAPGCLSGSDVTSFIGPRAMRVVGYAAAF